MVGRRSKLWGMGCKNSSAGGLLSCFKSCEGAISDNKALKILTKQETMDKFTQLQEIYAFLETLQLPAGLSQNQLMSFLCQASRYFITEKRLCRKQGSGQHQLVVNIDNRFDILHRAHIELGHKGIYPTRRTILN